RTFLLQGIGLVAFGLLGAFLSQSELGIFFVIDATVGLLVYFSDVGLGGALIQKHKNITKEDWATTFTILQVLTFSLSLIAFSFAPPTANFYNYGPESVNLFRALVFAFFTSSLKTIPSIRIERDLEFNKLSLPQILENLVFYAIAV